MQALVLVLLRSVDTFVFQLSEESRAYVFHASGRNKFFMHSTDKSIGVGGPDNFAIAINADFLNGSSGPCETFSSPRLAGSPLFSCRMFELWTTVPVS